ncbi:DUF445 domain-containing protein [Flammeovirga kamogawensis]|uniref:DUF445 family protein n=1 Tax=Flammeovirga kamogawensis TaxID=373891 RepID=A0ABX8GXU7_9BACT|nr:hypothetical protein [Flammeovirga kamogawensis]MBB6460568.1 uncharacterized membrane protein YheB (UPF0754 family) [Flammeovirga kamogawensis]QWG07927.1 hypothetical protein KM029_03050 [Flammeovirga kamogawensis]TRX69734.1 hypothetical protein EO216_16980 [Flammeovirga kamogawensis]
MDSTFTINDFFLYISIPLISGFVGWFTNFAAIKMMFYPIHFFGIRPFGWQGIIPTKSTKIASKSVDLLTAKLLKIEDQFALLDPDIVSHEMEESLSRVTRKTVDLIMQSEIPYLWENSPTSVKISIYESIEEKIPGVTEKILFDIGRNIREMLDLKKLTLDTVLEKPGLLNEIFMKCGEKEFKFIEISGLYFGFLFGLVQMVIAYFYNPWWLLPLFGVFVGYATNWLALKLIFEPKEPIYFLGMRFQGLFLQRQITVAEVYSKIITQEILTTERIFRYTLQNTGKKKLSEIFNIRISELVDDTYDDIKDVIQKFVDEDFAKKHLGIVKNIAHFTFMAEFHICLRDAFPYADQVFDLKNNIQKKIEDLPYEDFEGLLRPAFKEDEWILISVGAILGGCAGVLQFILLFQ